jgi:Fanconi anemia group M protein
MDVLKISPREYQKKIFETCVEKNCLVVLPTGLGKTLIALMLTVDRMQKFPGEKVLFLAPTKPLAEQHKDYFIKNLPEIFAQIELFTGEINSKNRKKIWQTADIIFSTPQCIANDLKKGLYSLNDVCLLVEDEAHRCLKNYDYNFVAQKYKQQSKNQRILGLTASPGSEISRVKEICRNLSIESVEIRTRDSEDVKDYLQDLEFERVFVDFPEEFEEIRRPLKYLFSRYVDELKERKLLFDFPSKTNLLNLQKKISLMISRSGKDVNFNLFLGASACAQSVKLQHALELLETQTISGLNNYFKKMTEQFEKNPSKGAKKLFSSSEFNFCIIKTEELFLRKKEHPKIEKIIEIANNEVFEDSKAKLLIFTQFRETASSIVDKLNENKNMKAEMFVGQAKKISSGKTSGLSQKEQKKAIEDFSSGKVNVLVATSIGEEGLDIPEVNSVIFYEPVPSEIRKIQRAGRTARLMKGKLFILVTRKTRDESFYYSALSREKKMGVTIDSVKEILKNNNLYKKEIKQNSLNEFL